MDWFRQFRFKVFGFWRNRDRDADMAEEMRAHLDRLIAANRNAGMSPENARSSALRQFGNVPSLQQRSRDEWRFRWLEEFRDDVRFAIRQMRRSPMFTAVAAITLALGIGANSAMFALADRTLMRPLPYPNADRLVMISERSATRPRMPVSPLTWQDWHDQNHSFDQLATISTGLGGGPMLSGPNVAAESVERQSVSATFFDVLAVRPVAGRTFLAADEGPRPTVVVISEGVWRMRFGGDPTLIGSSVRLNGEPFTVIGVVPNEVQFTRPASIWTLTPALPASFKDRGLRFFEVIGRLKPGVTLAAAGADLSTITRQIAEQFPDTSKPLGVTVEPLRTAIVGAELELTSAFLLGVVAFVLLMCCANVANLLLARSRVRARELAVRAAIGAGHARIVRQLLTESLVLAAFGGALGMLVGKLILDVAPTFIPAGILPPAVQLSFDSRVMTFCAVAAIGVGVLFGILPAWQAKGMSPVQAMMADSRSITSGAGIFRSVLASGQIATAVLLMCGAGLLLRTMVVLGNSDVGYRADGDSVVTMDFTVPATRFGGEKLLQYYNGVEREVRAISGVADVGWASSLPWGSTELGRWPFEIIGDAPIDPAARPRADYAIASPRYFDTVDLPIVAGRGFADSDTAQSTAVCIVNEAFANRYLQGRNPIGQRVSMQPRLLNAPAVREIIGVAKQVKGRPDEVEDLLQVYVPLSQVPFTDVFLVVRSATGQAGALVPAIRAAATRQDPNIPVRRARTLDEIARESTARYRFRAQMAATFAALALLLATVGVFGVVMYSVEQRSREFAMRIALGATTANVLALVLGSASRVIGAGAVIGLIGAAALSRSIAMFLFGVQPLDPLTFGSVVIGVAITAVIATAAPAIRAARVDPLETFRCD
ncbi:MAG: ABC transporter permease [Cyanobacteria bacterium]|nr:ABC transporter permease [Cyanobacteriota bacterium]